MGNTARALQVVGVVALCLSFLFARALYSARSEWEAAEIALAEKRTLDAVIHLRRAASWDAPLSPYTARAQEALSDIARLERKFGREQHALWAERAQKDAAHAARTWRKSLPRDPHAGFVGLALFGWLAWTAAAFALVLHGLDKEGRIQAQALRPILAMAAGLLCFTLGLAFA